MALVPTFETLLLEIRKSFGLYSPKDRMKFDLFKSGEVTHRELFDNLKGDLLRHLKLSASDIHAFDFQVKDWSILSLRLNQDVYTSLASKKLVLWMLASHAYVPTFARLAAFWQSHSIMDLGMPAHKFWYLPEIEGGELVLPITQVWQWLDDLILNPKSTLVEQIYGEENSDGKSKRLGIDKVSLERNLLNWKAATGKETSKLLADYFSDDLKLQFSGTFKFDRSESLLSNIKRISSLLTNKGYTPETLYPEIQFENPEVIARVLNGVADTDLNERFIDIIAVRFAEPSNEIIMRYFNIAQAFQNAYMRFGRLIHGKGFSPRLIDEEKNKLNQLISIFKIVYNLTYQVSSEVNPTMDPNLYGAENRAFEDKLPGPFKETIFQSICSYTPNSGIEGLIDTLNFSFQFYGENEIPSVIILSPKREVGFHNDYWRMYTGWAEQYSTYKNIKDSKDIENGVEQVMSINTPHTLCYIAAQSRVDMNIRNIILNRLIDMDLTPSQKLRHYVTYLAFLLNNKEKECRPLYAEEIVENILKSAKTVDGYNCIESEFLQFEAKHELSRGNFDDAEKLFKLALDHPDRISIGSIRGEIARDLFALRAATQPKGYSLSNQLSLYRDMKMFGGFEFHMTVAWYWLADPLIKKENGPFPSINLLEKQLINEYYSDLFVPY